MVPQALLTAKTHEETGHVHTVPSAAQSSSLGRRKAGMAREMARSVDRTCVVHVWGPEFGLPASA